MKENKIFVLTMGITTLSKINALLLGHGYWGKNLLRNLSENTQTASIIVADTNSNRLEDIAFSHNFVTTTTNPDAAIQRPDINAIIIATPTSTHYTLTKTALLAGKHVLVEKPFCTTTQQAQELCNLAEERGLTLMVDHVYLANPVVHQLKKYLHDNATGSIQYIDSTRINLGVYQTDTNVLWDLACHDISIINYLTGEKPVAVRAIGKINPQHEMEDVVYLFLNYASGMLVHINASWASPVKIRKMIIGGEKRMLIYDDIEPTNKLTIYDYGQNTPMDSDKSFLIDYRLGNITMPKCEIQEPLKNVIADFYSGILHNIQPISTGKNALETVRILEAAQQSLLGGGKLVDL